MPITRGLHRAQLWNPSSYVCHTCRHKILAGRRSLTRSQSNLHSSRDGGDSWASNFNDLTDSKAISEVAGSFRSPTSKDEDGRFEERSSREDETSSRSKSSRKGVRANANAAIAARSKAARMQSRKAYRVRKEGWTSLARLKMKPKETLGWSFTANQHETSSAKAIEGRNAGQKSPSTSAGAFRIRNSTKTRAQRATERIQRGQGRSKETIGSVRSRNSRPLVRTCVSKNSTHGAITTAGSTHEDSRTQLENFIERFSATGVVQQMLGALRGDVRKDESQTDPEGQAMPDIDATSPPLPQQPTITSTIPSHTPRYQSFKKIYGVGSAKIAQPVHMPSSSVLARARLPQHAGAGSKDEQPMLLAQKLGELQAQRQGGGTASLPPRQIAEVAATGRSESVANSEIAVPASTQQIQNINASEAKQGPQVEDANPAKSPEDGGKPLLASSRKAESWSNTQARSKERRSPSDRRRNAGRGEKYTTKLSAGIKAEAQTGPAALDTLSPESNSGASGTDGGHGDDDGDHKSLWEVMSKAGAFDVKSLNASPNLKLGKSDQPEQTPLDLSGSELPEIVTIKPSELVVKPLNVPQPPVPGLEYGLDRVLFNPGVYQLQDPLSRVYNFDPYLQKIMPVVEFDFNALKEYKTSSQDKMLSALAKENGKRYIGSTSSMTSMLGHFHYLLSDWRPLNLSMLSRGFSDKLDSFTLLNRAPNAVFLRWKNGTYAIDADKQYDSGNVLMLLGKSMEKLLTMPTSEYERYRKSDPRSVSNEERNAPEAFEFTTMGDFLMRSQLDAYDPRLPGTGMFDLKTRAVISVRMDAEDFQPMTGYEIYTLQGRFGSYEREFYDMMRSTMLKYMLQARMGRMDGIFVAYHNVERIFGFQYLPIQELDRAIHGQVDRCLGDQEFKTSLQLLNKVFDRATAKFPEQSLRFHFETTTESLGSSTPTTVMWIFAEPMADDEINQIQSTAKAKVAEFERTMMGFEANLNSTENAPEDVKVEHNDKNTAFSETSTTSKIPSTSPDASGTRAASAADFTTSNSHADPDFLESISSPDFVNRKPLFAASLICKSRIDGELVQRPQNFKPDQTWEVEYVLREWNAPDAMWARYDSMKTRRQQMFAKLRNEEEQAEDGEDGEFTAKQKQSRAFIEFLKSMSKNGREFRNKLDQQDAGKEPVIVGRAPPRGVEEYSGNVDEYLAWLYGSGEV